MECRGRGEVEEEVLDRIRPSKTQLSVIGMFYKMIKSRIEECISTRGMEAVVEVEGSYAKGTMLSDKWEIDVFVLFKGVEDEWIEVEAEELLKDCLQPLPVISKYSQHPYVTVHLMGLEADIVPALWLEKPRPHGMGVERTPFHKRYVTSKLDECTADDVRLLKSFLKGIGVYGAETQIGGFSGYLSELLIIWGGNFRRLLERMAEWRPPVYIDPEGVGDKDRLLEKYKSSPLIVVDPVDPERNAAAAVTLKSLATAIAAAKLYVRNPSTIFFHVYKGEVKFKTSMRLSLVAVECRGSYGYLPPQDVGGKLRRLERSLTDHLSRQGFNPISSGSDWDGWGRIVVYAVLESLTTSAVESLRGPPAWEALDNVLMFAFKRISEGGHVWIGDDGRLRGVRGRRYRHATDAAQEWLNSAPLPRGTRSCRVVSCPGRECTGWLERVVTHGLNLTPAWIIGALTPGKQ